MGSEMLFLPQKQEKMKSSFTQTCNRFSQFLRERRSLAHLDAFKTIASSENDTKGMTKDVSTAKNTSMFSKNMENERMSLELFPLMSSSTATGLESSSIDMNKSSELAITKEEHKITSSTPSMTIFYGGKVMVIDELSEDKAMEIMSLASRGTMNSVNSHLQTQIQTQARTQISTPIQTPTPHLTQDVVPQGASIFSDLPIARSVSLHRFMEKRKHRITASAPYQVQTNSLKPMSNSHPKKLNLMRSLYDKQQLELKL